jgi:hypothetical protein
MLLNRKIPQIASTPPPFYTWMGFSPHIFPITLILVIPHILFTTPRLHYHILKTACRSHLSTLLHNSSLPLDKTTFPSALNLFFVTGTIDPP